ncbi:MAG: glutamyl-tRNA reductase [Ignavibacteriales bacterium CG_4_9_14_3_um_filter_30_11]|nr:MAG: glutamyl-tRNA reductase [Ignavibacteriales bacterium CG_4_9_14_3_um_filter_30_11]
MNLLAIAINHHTAPVEVREALHLNDDEIRTITLKAKEKLFTECLIVSTCNRTEVYGIPKNVNTLHTDVQNFLLNGKSNIKITEENFQNFSSSKAVQHLFEVIAGINSQIVGDNQIFKQIKSSFQIADDLQASGFLMRHLFASSTRVGKRVITETSISEGAVTISFASVQLIEKIFSSLGKKSALVIGTGETGEIAAKHLRDRGIGKLTITNRTKEKADKLAETLKCSTINFNEFKSQLYQFDIIISATSYEGLILTKKDIESSMKERKGSTVVLMDIAVPRDIDPDSKYIDHVFYKDIDSLNIIVEQSLKKRNSEIPKVKLIIKEELEEFGNWYNSLDASPTIRTLREHFENIRAEEVKKNKNKFLEGDHEKLEIITKRIINKLLHYPTTELRKAAEQENDSVITKTKVGILKEMFGIDKSITEKKNNNE